MRTGSRPAEIAAGVYWVAEGTGKSNVYLVRSGSSWVLIDAAWPHKGELIKTSAETLFGADTAPAAILLTHLHPDDAGPAAELARAWNVPVYADPGELPLPTGKLAYSDPIGRVIGPFTRLLPDGEFGAALRIVTASDPRAGVPGLPDWEAHSHPGPHPWPCQLLPPERQGADHRRCPADRERQIAAGPAARAADDLRPAAHFDLELGGGHGVRCPARRARAAGAGTWPRDAHDHSGDGGGLALFRRPPDQRAESGAAVRPARRLQPPDPVSSAPPVCTCAFSRWGRS